MLSSSAQVIWCLLTYTDWWQPSSASVMQIARHKTDSDGLHPGVLDTLDERTELRRRVALMEERDRHVLVLWYVRQLPLKEIARELGLSGRQCQRLRAKAVKTVVDLGQQDSEEAVA